MSKPAGAVLLGLRPTWDTHSRLLSIPGFGKRYPLPSARGTNGDSGEHPTTVKSPLRYEGGRIVASINIESMPLLATIDTGASRSFVSEAVARRLTTARNQRSVCSRINLADGTLREVTQALMVSIHCGQRQVPISMLILPKLLDDVILGMDFLCGMEARIGCGPTQLQLRPTTTAIPIATVTTVRTLPKVELTIDQTGAKRTPGLPGVCMEAIRTNPFRKPRIAAKAAREETQVKPASTTEVQTPPEQCAAENSREISTEEEAWISRFLQEELLPIDQITGVSPIAEHTIVLRDNRPIKQRYYPKNPAMQKIIDAQVDELLRDGRIEPSKSPHSAPIVLVGKKTGDMRMCCNDPFAQAGLTRSALWERATN